jgi:hypothetical protein
MFTLHEECRVLPLWWLAAQSQGGVVVTAAHQQGPRALTREEQRMQEAAEMRRARRAGVSRMEWARQREVEWGHQRPISAGDWGSGSCREVGGAASEGAAARPQTADNGCV